VGSTSLHACKYGRSLHTNIFSSSDSRVVGLLWTSASKANDEGRGFLGHDSTSCPVPVTGSSFSLEDDTTATALPFRARQDSFCDLTNNCYSRQLESNMGVGSVRGRDTRSNSILDAVSGESYKQQAHRLIVLLSLPAATSQSGSTRIVWK